MKNEGVSYKQIVKTTGIYGSSQLVNVAIGILRSKLTALLIGTVGIGIIGLLQSVIDLSRSATGLGLDMGATKKIAVTDAYSAGDLPKTLFIVNVWYVFTAILGALFCIVFARPLSIRAFGNTDFEAHIAVLSIAVLFVTLTGGLISSLQGLRKIAYMALASSIGSLVSLVVAIPLYYYLRLDGIILVFVVSNLMVFLVSLFFYGKIEVRYEKISLREVWHNGRGMVRLGLYIVLGGMLSAVSLFAVRSYISREAGVDEVGLFQAAWLTSFLISGLVLRSANSDFFPKLCSLIDDRSDVRRFVNEQTYIILLIISPLIIGLFAFGEYVIYLLYTSDFVISTQTFRWHLAAIFLKMASTPAAMVILAANRGRLHFVCEAVFWLVYLFACYFLYQTSGLEGTGMAFLAAYVVYVPVVLIAAGRVSDVRWGGSVSVILLINIVLLAVLLFVSEFYSSYTLLLGALFFGVTLVASFVRLRLLVLK